MTLKRKAYDGMSRKVKDTNKKKEEIKLIRTKKDCIDHETTRRGEQKKKCTSILISYFIFITSDTKRAKNAYGQARQTTEVDGDVWSSMGTIKGNPKISVLLFMVQKYSWMNV